MPNRLPLVVLAMLLAVSPAFAAKRALFDNAHAETAGNADWEIDTHQPVPSPDQAGIGPNTAGTFWVGAISSWGVDLVKRGYNVTTNTVPLTYQNGSNPNDLANYDVLIIDEPNTLFSAGEAAAILAFVSDGGGLIAVSDHSGSDRNNDGADSPQIWNALDPTHLLGVHFGVSGDANNNIVQTSANVNPAADDSVTQGAVGAVAGLAFHNGTTMTLFPGTNPSVRGEVWMTGLPQTSTTGVMAASAVYGSGRVFFVGDSSPCDDGSAAPGNSSIFDGWGEAGATDSTLFLNATLWATRRGGSSDVTPPTVTVNSPNGGEDWKAGSMHAITWTATDDVGVTSVELAYSTDGGATYPTVLATGLANSGSWPWTVPTPLTTGARIRATARDAAGNASSDASDASFAVSAWTITASAGPGGSISPAGTQPVLQGASRSFSITPAAGHHIADVLVDGVSVGPVAGYTFTNIVASHTISASFAIDTHTLAVTILGSGSVTRSPDQASYDAGTPVTLTAAPAAGWHFANWSGDASGSANPLTVTMDQDRNVTAAFLPDQYALDVATVGRGSVQRDPDVALYDPGTIVTLTAAPLTGYSFSAWAGDASGADDPLAITMDAPKSLSAIFRPIVVELAPSGGESVPLGSVLEIRWAVSDSVGAATVDLLISRQGVGGPYDTLVAGVSNSGSYPWTVDGTPTPNAFIEVVVHDAFGSSGSDVTHAAFAITGVLSAPDAAIRDFALEPAWPNPAQRGATIRFAVPHEAPIRLSVLDVQGREVAVLADGPTAAGRYGVEWNALAGGRPTPPGLYLVRLVTPRATLVRRLVLVR